MRAVLLSLLASLPSLPRYRQVRSVVAEYLGYFQASGSQVLQAVPLPPLLSCWACTPQGTCGAHSANS
jgi:hypothetical protein